MPIWFAGKMVVSTLILIAVTINIVNGQSCSVPTFPPNLLTFLQQCLPGSSISLGTICTYVCEEDYVLVGNDTVDCTQSSPVLVLPTCQAITCLIPQFPPNLLTSDQLCLNGNEITYGTTCPYQCDMGYDLVGDSQVTCLVNGSLSAPLPSCEAITCLIPQFSPNLLTSDQLCSNGNEITYETTCPYHCDMGYDLVGLSQVTCLVNGSLSAPLPSCEAVVCQLPEVFPPLLLSSFANCSAGSTIAFGTSCTMQCPTGYSPTVTCQSDGTLSQRLPDCTAIDTYIVIARFLNRTFTSSLSDKTSSYFSQVAQEFISFIQTPLRNSFEETLSVTVNSFASGSIIAEFFVYIRVGNRTTVQQDLEHVSVIHATMINIAESDPNYMDPASIRTFSTVSCPAGTVITEYGSVAMFENGAINSRADSTNATCPYYTERGGRPIEALCEGDYMSPCNWVIPQRNCRRNLTVEEILDSLKNVQVTEENAANFAKVLAAITAMGQDISQDDLSVAVDLLELITRINSTDIQVTESVVEIADNIAALPDEQLEDAEEEDSAPSRVVLALESQLAVVEVGNGSVRFVETNIAAEVLDVTTEDINQGYTVFMSATDTGESISDEDFQVREGDLTQEPKATESQATLFIPSGLADSFSERKGRLVITTYRVPSLFQDKSIAEFNQNAVGFNRTVNSRIISASINNEKVEDLREPVRISFVPLNPNGTNATCVFWDFDEKAWSQRGCVTKSNDSTDRIECECNHLTNFGILMDIYGGDPLTVQEDFILEIFSYIGCLMSIWGLVFTIFTYATNKELRDQQSKRILLSLFSALLGLYVVFLVMISLDTDRDVTELPLVPCSIMAAFLHYFVLASIFWMGVEGYYTYKLVVRVSNYLPWFMRKASLVAWGVPLLIVGVTAGASRQHYAQTDFCFLTFWPSIGGLLVPIGVVMIFNFFFYIAVLTGMNKTVEGKQLDKAEKRQRQRHFQNAVCIMILMGLTWSVGYLSIIQPASVVVQGVFTVLNSLQGYFIFMLYCLRQPEVRTLWRSQFSCCLPKSFNTPSASNSSSGQTNSTFRNNSGMPVAKNRNRNVRLISNPDSSGFRPDTAMRAPPERVSGPLYNYGFAK